VIENGSIDPPPAIGWRRAFEGLGDGSVELIALAQIRRRW